MQRGIVATSGARMRARSPHLLSASLVVPPLTWRTATAADTQDEALFEPVQAFLWKASVALVFASCRVLLWRMQLAVSLHASQRKS